jgi:HEAT repeat protein
MWLFGTAGCASFSMPQYWPFPERERTSFHTPAMRVDAVSQFASRSTHVDSPEQRELSDQLARQIQIEPDPIVRTAVIEAIAEFRTPIAQQVLEAGLSDKDTGVRVACCKALGRRADPTTVPKLAAILRTDEDIDVRLAATEALGNIRTPQAMQALVIALDDRDPALQFVGVESLKSITGKDFGPNVAAWRQVAAGGPSPPEVPSLAERILDATRL